MSEYGSMVIQCIQMATHSEPAADVKTYITRLVDSYIYIYSGTQVEYILHT